MISIAHQLELDISGRLGAERLVARWYLEDPVLLLGDALSQVCTLELLQVDYLLGHQFVVLYGQVFVL